ncbi:MAG: ribonuclease III [Actinomycetaceae bacterium]|nr:ribonuclease III [Actinomycetaceae bacterium]
MPDTAELLARWGVDIPADLLQHALTHRSYAFENECADNERLEFLGDSILGGVVAVDLFRDYPDMSEGDLSKIKAAAVSERALAEVARKLDLGAYLYLGVGEERTGGRQKDSLLADAVEALIAATYLAHGLDEAVAAVRRHIAEQILIATQMGPALDWRTAFEEKAREHGIIGDLSYQMDGTGPDHARVFTAQVMIGGKRYGTGTATSRKAAKLEACKDAYLTLEPDTVA